MTVDIGSRAPAFRGTTADGRTVSLEDFAGRPLVLYFYPRDMTPGCTTEACDFRDRMAAIEKLGAAVVGVSPDTPAAHARFIEKERLNFTLVADPERTICRAYGVWVEKTMYGKRTMGVERTTFLIDGDGIVRRVWRKVKVRGHAQEVLDALEALVRGSGGSPPRPKGRK